MKHQTILTFVALFTFTAASAIPFAADARGRTARAVYHATSKKAGKSISKTGKLDMKKASPRSRFGGGAYFAPSRKQAIKERGLKNGAVFQGKASKKTAHRSWRVNHWSTDKMRRKSGLKDLRGTRKKGIVGPKLGRRLGKAAGKEGRGIYYRPRGARRGARNNLYVPPKLYDTTGSVSRLKRAR